MCKYEQLKEEYPKNVLLKICVDEYEKHLRDYMSYGLYRYKLDMDVISNIIKLFLNLPEDMDTF
jgi:hypothetical protein